MGLVLDRARGQSIIIGGVIKVTLEDIRGTHVRLNIDAPRSITVHREEFQRQLERESHNQQSHPAAGDVAGAGKAVV